MPGDCRGRALLEDLVETRTELLPVGQEVGAFERNRLERFLESLDRAPDGGCRRFLS
jgi:hypothetical protein